MSDRAALLREAAQTLREKAEAATPGRWEKERARSGSRLLSCVIAPPDLAVTIEVLPADAAHIALMDPTVALAVAGWLDDVAETHEIDAEQMTRAFGKAGPEYTRPVPTRALAVARAVLRRES